MSILLERNNTNPDIPDKYGQTPLSFAARNGHEWVVGILPEQNDINPTLLAILVKHYSS